MRTSSRQSAAPIPALPPDDTAEAGVKIPAKEHLGDLLVRVGLATRAEVELGLHEQARSGERLGKILVDQGAVHSGELAQSLAALTGMNWVDLDTVKVDPAAAKALPEPFSRRQRVLPIGWDSKQLVVAVADPTNWLAFDDIHAVAGPNVKFVAADPDLIDRAINQAWRGNAGATGPGPSAASKVEMDIDDAASQVETADAPVVRFVTDLMARAVKEGASDVHLEAMAEGGRVRFRVDGMLQNTLTLTADLFGATVSRLKVMGELDISERRRPQDGRMSLTSDGRQVDVRIATLPTISGEAMVLRLLDRSQGLLNLEQLGFLPDTLARYELAYQRPWGTICITGPTGSGKSTVLYATVAALNSPHRNIVTVEDPVEYELAGIKQVQVNRKVGLTFATALRSVLRSDPDVVLVGEVRDAETAAIAAQAALTGHLVLSTLHTNDAASTPMRLIEMGLEPFLVASSLDCVVNQRLARRLCSRCRVGGALTDDEAEAVGWTRAGLEAKATVFRAKGCQSCRGSGFRGRFAIQEVVVISEEIRHLILARAPSSKIAEVAETQGTRTLWNDGLRKVAAGFTSLEELGRVARWETGSGGSAAE